MDASAVRQHPPQDSLELRAGIAPDDVANDAELVRSAARLTRDLNRAKPMLYWLDLSVTALVGYGALLMACLSGVFWWKAATGVVAVLALYRAVSFIHELTHLKPSSVPGFRTAWNLLVGAPLMAPSFMYDQVHLLHHAHTRYGTAQDPEYLPLARLRPATLGLFLAASALAPLALILRFALLAPLSAMIPRLRRWTVESASALAINPAFRRAPPKGALRRFWGFWETVTSCWAVTLVALTLTGIVSRPAFLTFLAVTSGVTVLNQVRTLAAHLWESEGEQVSIARQYLDSVNVPPPTLLPALWAPVGLRYHALHHLLPGLPYHALGEAHRRLSAALPPESAYHGAHHRGLRDLLRRLVAASTRAASSAPTAALHDRRSTESA